MPIESASEHCYGLIESLKSRVEEYRTVFVGDRTEGLALVENGRPCHFKKDAMPTEGDHIRGVRAAGKYDGFVGSETEARRIVQQAIPYAMELPPGVVGTPYPSPPVGVKAWFQVQPAEPLVGNDQPHVKYADWTAGKKGAGGSWGHLFFPSV